MYKIITMTISMASSTSLGHLFKTFKLSRVKFLICFKKDFKSISIKCFSFLIRPLAPPTTGLSHNESTT